VVGIESDADALADGVVVVAGHEREHLAAARQAQRVVKSPPRKVLRGTSAVVVLASSWTTSSGRSSTSTRHAGPADRWRRVACGGGRLP
jgi:hypothetical protein